MNNKGKKSRFWGNFWGETGRNTGKWASNKIFGNAGWATPKRLIIESDSSKTHRRNTISPSGSRNRVKDSSGVRSEKPSRASRNNVQDEFDFILEQKKASWDEARHDTIMKMAKSIKFNSRDIDDICSKLDDLLVGATKANKYMEFSSHRGNIFVPKIQAGIMRLDRLGEPEIARFYRKQLRNLRIAHFWRINVPRILAAIFILFVFLWYLAVM